jgi:hypothetical protein
MLTQDELKKIVTYDPNSGIFTRNITTSTNAKEGDIAGTLDTSTGYITFQLRKRNTIIID